MNNVMIVIIQNKMMKMIMIIQKR